MSNPTDEKLERLLDAFHIAAQRLNLAPELIHNRVTGTALERRYAAARAALREYVSARTLTAEEAQVCLYYMDGGKEDDNISFIKKLRRASMKEQE